MIESGTRTPKPENLEALAQGLGITKEEIFKLAGIEIYKRVIDLNENKDYQFITFAGHELTNKEKQAVKNLLKRLRE